jgi:hypothetical protein
MFVPRQAAVQRLPQPIGERQLLVLAAPTDSQVFLDEFVQPQAFVQLSHQQQAAVGSDSRALEINFQRGAKRELKGPILCFTLWAEASANVVFFLKAT